jgi:uncharacterized protein YbjT (DUF2867 family)
MERIAVIGATGYVGGRLVSELLRAGFRVRAIARSVEKLRCRPYAASPHLEITRADACREEELTRALNGCSCCFFLINRTGEPGPPGNSDIAAARNLVQSAQAGGLSRIIYLGRPKKMMVSGAEGVGSAPVDPGQVLTSGPVPVTWLRTPLIIGSGSAAFEILRYLTERLPVMVAPRWVEKPIRPIAVSDVIRYLAACIRSEETAGLVSDIGGPDVLSFRDLIDIYADAAGLPRRRVFTLPLEARRFSAYWINLVTPVPYALARFTLESIDEAGADGDESIRKVISFPLTTIRDAVATALQKVQQQDVESCWSDAGSLRPPEWLMCGDAEFAGGDVLDCSYRIVLDCPPQKVWENLRGLGGRHGWFFGNILWRLRGFFDRLLGGVGSSRGRRSLKELRTGDAVDFWRVLLAEERSRLIMLAEMKVPGEAVLQFSLYPRNSGCELIQVARFLPRGLFGLIYWYSMAPFHDYLFKGMLSTIARESGCAIIREPERFTGGGDICRLPEEWGRID